MSCEISTVVIQEQIAISKFSPDQLLEPGMRIRANFIRSSREEKTGSVYSIDLLGDPEVTANIYCKSRNLPNTDTQNYSTDLR